MRISGDLNYPYNAILMQPPGHRGYRRLLQSVMRSLTQAALSPKFVMPAPVKITLFHLVSEYSVAAFQAASLASDATVIITLPNDSFILDKELLAMLYLDYLVFGYATFEVAGDLIIYSDPRQFSVPSVNVDGSPSVRLADADVSDRVGVIPRCPNPFGYCRSVPELIPQVFMFFLSFHSKLFYDLSPFRKPDLLIVTSETMSSDELALRRRRLIEQAEEDYGSLLMMTHSSDDKPQIIDLAKGESAGAALAEKLYDRQIELLNRACGLVEDMQLNYPLNQFFAALADEVRRLLPESEVSISFRSGNGDD